MSVTMAVHSGHRYHFYIRSRFNLDAWHEKQSFLVHACLAWGIGFLPRMVLKGCHDFLPSPCVVSGAVRTAALVQGPNSQSASFRHIKLQNVSVGLNQPQIVKSNQPIPVDRNQPIAPDGVDAPAIELRYVTASLAVRRVVWSLGVGPRPRRYQAHARGSSALAS